MSNEKHTVLLRHTDSDGDALEIIHDPLDGDAEDVLIYVYNNEEGHTQRVAVRVPFDVLRRAVSVAPRYGEAEVAEAIRRSRMTEAELLASVRDFTDD